MIFTDLAFVFVFLPVLAGILFLLRGRGRKVAALLTGLLFFAYSGFLGLSVLILLVLLHYAAGITMELLDLKGKVHIRTGVFVFVIAVDVAGLFFLRDRGMIYVVGQSFATLSALSYLVDVYSDRTEATWSLVDLSLYILFFPKILVGPWMPFAAFREAWEEKTFDRNDLSNGLFLFARGLCKVVLPGDYLGRVFASAHVADPLTMLDAWVALLTFVFGFAYFVSGMLDMAEGLARMFGVATAPSFSSPYMAPDTPHFFERFHGSLTQWFRENIERPIGGENAVFLRSMAALFAAWIAGGLFLGFSWHYLAFGIYHFLFAALYRVIGQENLDLVPLFVRVGLSDLIIVCGWVFFFVNDVPSAFVFFKALLGNAPGGLYGGDAVLLLRQAAFPLIATIVISLPGVRRWHDGMVYEHWGLARKIFWGVYALIFLLTVAHLVMQAPYGYGLW